MVLAPPLRQENVPEACMHVHFGEGVAGVSLPDRKSESREPHFRLSPFLFVARLGGLITHQMHAKPRGKLKSLAY